MFFAPFFPPVDGLGWVGDGLDVVGNGRDVMGLLLMFLPQSCTYPGFGRYNYYLFF